MWCSVVYICFGNAEKSENNETEEIGLVTPTSDMYFALVIVTLWVNIYMYRKNSSISRTKSQNLNISHLVLPLSLPIPLKLGVKSRMRIVVGAAPTADAPTKSEWSSILLPTKHAKVRLILEVLP